MGEREREYGMGERVIERDGRERESREEERELERDR